MHVRSQAAIATELATRCRDTYHTRWTLAEKHTAINHAIGQWGDRVSFPCQELLSNAWDSDLYAYVVPSYVNLNTLRVQRNETDPTATANEGRWIDIPGWDVQPLTNGNGWQIVTRTRQVDGDTARLFWYAQNSEALYPYPALSAEITAAATTLTLASAAQNLSSVGHVLIDAEWIAYRGVVVNATTTVLQNLTRGLFNTTAAIHALGATVMWGITVLDTRLYEQMYNQAQMFLHQLSLQNAAEQAREYHERMVSHHGNLADRFWASYFNPAWGKTRQRKAFSV